MTPYTLTFTINETPKSPNALLGAHWTTRAGHAKKWERLVWSRAWAFKPPQPLTSARVELIRRSVRKMDADNARSSFKPVMDALVKLGILLDDNVNVVGEPTVIQEKAQMRKSSITVTVEEICAD